MRDLFTTSSQALHGGPRKLAYFQLMTRLFWILIAAFPLPLVLLLLAGPPELFERERLLASQDVIDRLDAAQVDWPRLFGQDRRIDLGPLLPEKAIEYAHFGFALEYQETPDRPILVASSGPGVHLLYRFADACWDIPGRQLTLMRRC